MHSEEEEKANMMPKAHGMEKYQSREETVALLTKKQEALGIYPALAFCLIGCTQLVGWNALLNAGYSVSIDVWGLPALPTLAVALYSAVNCLGTILSIIFSKFFVRPIITIIGISLTIIDSFLFIIILYTSSSVSAGLILLVGTLMGCSSALIGCSAIGYANIFPRTYAGAISAGLGVSGVYTFAVWMLSHFAIFRANDENRIRMTQNAAVVTMSLAIFTAVCSAVALYIFFQNEEVKYIMKKQRSIRQSVDYTNIEEDLQKNSNTESKTEVLPADADMNASEILKEVTITLKNVWDLAFCIFFGLTVTLFIFPNVSPNRMGLGDTIGNILIGIYQVGDLIGRYMPNGIPWLLMKKKGIYIMTAARALFIPLFLLSWKTEVAFLRNPFYLTILMLLFAITNGLVQTAAYVEMPNHVHTTMMKARCGSVGAFGSCLGVVAGSWSSTLLLAIWS